MIDLLLLISMALAMVGVCLIASGRTAQKRTGFGEKRMTLGIVATSIGGGGLILAFIMYYGEAIAIR